MHHEPRRGALHALRLHAPPPTLQQCSHAPYACIPAPPCCLQTGTTSSVAAHMLRNYALTLRGVLVVQQAKGTLGQEQAEALRWVGGGAVGRGLH